MATIFRLDASIRAIGSQSRAVASALEESIRAHLPEVNFVKRDAGLSPLPASEWPLAFQASQKGPSERTPDEVRAAALATELADEMVVADAFIFAVPLYSYGISQSVRGWIDLLVTDPRFNLKVPSGSNMLSGACDWENADAD